jgi:hypothetical protein
MNTLTAKSLKATMVIAADELAALVVPDGQRCVIRVNVAGSRIVTADLNAKSVRKAIATIKASGPDAVACILQGRLDQNNSLLDAGLAVQLKTKPDPATT